MKRRMRQQQRIKNKGFTLIEIMVVVMILAILAAVVAPNMLNKPEEARLSTAKHDIKVLETTLGLYRMDNFTYPSTGEGLNALVSKPSGATAKWSQYVKKVPKDPWGRDYKYRVDGKNIEIYTLGADGTPGGDDDVSSKNLD